jgi:hypothetical protein
MAKYTRTRMNKHREQISVQLSSGADITTFQIENGAEELQLKRIFATAATDGSDAGMYTLDFAISDEPFVATSDFSDTRIVFSGAMGPGQGFVWNETQTIRIPRGYHLGILLDGDSSNVNPEQVLANVQVNYLVLA